LGLDGFAACGMRALRRRRSIASLCSLVTPVRCLLRLVITLRSTSHVPRARASRPTLIGFVKGSADATGAPHVVPVGWTHNPDLGTIDITGTHFAATRKYRNVQANPRAAFVVDDVLPPFHPRCVMIQGTAQALDAAHATGTEAVIRIVPDKITSWGLDNSPPSTSS